MGLLMQAASTSATMRGAQIAAQGDVLAGQASAQADTFNSGVALTNAQILNQAAVQTGQAGEAQAGISEMGTRATVGGIRAAQGAAGIDIDTQSAGDVRASAASKGMLDALTIRANAAKQAYSYQTEARSQAAQAELSKSQAGYDIAGANIKSKATILSAKADAGKGFGNYLLQSGLIPTDMSTIGGAQDITSTGGGMASGGLLTNW